MDQVLARIPPEWDKWKRFGDGWNFLEWGVTGTPLSELKAVYLIESI